MIESDIRDYEKAYRDFVWQVPERFNFGFDIVDRFAADQGRLALLYVDEELREQRYTFDHFRASSNKFGNLLKQLGLARGDRVMVMLARIPEWQTVMLGVLKIGTVAIPSTTLLRPKDIEYRLNAAEARAIVTDPENAEKIESVADRCKSLEHLILVGGKRRGWISCEEAMLAAPADLQAEKSRSDDPALLYFTSGTVGEPKMVLHAHAYTFAHRLTGAYWLDLKPADLHWNLSDTGWAKAAYSTLFGPWSMGTAVFMYKGGFKPKETLDLLARYPITVFCAPPTAFRMLVKEELRGYRFKLRHVVSAGEPLNPEVIEVWREATSLTIHDGYGQTESIILVANFPGMRIKPGSMGRPMPGHEVAIVDEDGRELGPGREGEIAVRGSPPSLFKGYWRNAEATARARKGEWYLTGDRAYKDEDGYFWFVGRADDVIISAGYRIGPFEVESALVGHPAVVEAAAVAAPDPLRGNVVKAFVVLRKGYKPSEELARELQEHVKRVTAPYKYPRIIEFVEDLPKTISGKIRRVELRQRESRRN